jgi:hypothetical protein
MFNIQDIFGGGGGSQAQGAPTVTGAGDGGKKDAINSWLSTITGAYQAVTGSGTKSGPAPAPLAAPAKSNWIPYAVGALVIAGLLWFAFKKK